MGVAVHAVKEVTSGHANAGDGIGNGVSVTGKQVGAKAAQIEKMTSKTMANFDAGSKCSPVISQCRGVGEGMIQGDCKKIASNGGVLALTLMPSTGVGIKSANAAS